MYKHELDQQTSSHIELFSVSNTEHITMAATYNKIKQIKYVNQMHDKILVIS